MIEKKLALVTHIFENIAEIKGREIIPRRLGAADQLRRAVLAQQHLGGTQLAVVIVAH